MVTNKQTMHEILQCYWRNTALCYIILKYLYKCIHLFVQDNFARATETCLCLLLRWIFVKRNSHFVYICVCVCFQMAKVCQSFEWKISFKMPTEKNEEKKTKIQNSFTPVLFIVLYLCSTLKRHFHCLRIFHAPATFCVQRRMNNNNNTISISLLLWFSTNPFNLL